MSKSMIASMWILNPADMIKLRVTDPYSLHRIVYDLFEDVRNEEQKLQSVSSGILYVDKGEALGRRRVLILSDRHPKQPLHGMFSSHPVPASFLLHDCYQFEVVVNPTKRDCKTGKTLAIQGRQAIAEWFASQAANSWGFSVKMETVQIDNIHAQRFRKSHEQTVTQSSATVSGYLSVIDRERFSDKFCKGIGRGRAFGFGLLQLVPIQKNKHYGVCNE